LYFALPRAKYLANLPTKKRERKKFSNWEQKSRNQIDVLTASSMNKKPKIEKLKRFLIIAKKTAHTKNFDYICEYNRRWKQAFFACLPIKENI
jgi:hypothetical protein